MIEIAPNVFTRDWQDVKYGYIHGLGNLTQFVFAMEDGHSVAVRNPEDIETTLRIWRSCSDAPLAEIDRMPVEIEAWLPLAKTMTTGKKARRTFFD